MSISIGDVWISHGGFAIDITGIRSDGWYEYDQINGNCNGYVSPEALQRRFTKLGAQA